MNIIDLGAAQADGRSMPGLWVKKKLIALDILPMDAGRG
jgi:hypothetical protein